MSIGEGNDHICWCFKKVYTDKQTPALSDKTLSRVLYIYTHTHTHTHTISHGVISQKTRIFINVATRNSNLPSTNITGNSK